MKFTNRIIRLGCSCALMLCTSQSIAQTVTEILSDGIRLKKDEYIFLKMKNGTLEYSIRDINSTRNTFSMPWDKDVKLYILSSQNPITILTEPNNPLQHLYHSEVTFTTDKTDSIAANAIRDLLKSLPNPAGLLASCTALYGTMVSDITSINASLSDNQRAEIVGAFKKLKALDFSKSGVEAELRKIETDDILPIATHYNALQTRIDNLKNQVVAYKQDVTTCQDAFIVKKVFGDVIKDVEIVKEAQLKRFALLKKVADDMNKIIGNAKNSTTGVPWILDLSAVPVLKPAKVTQIDLSVLSPQFALNDTNELIEQSPKEKVKYTIIGKKFRRFVPEVSAGIAYTWINFPKYGTEKNDNGEDVITDAGNDVVKRLAISTMVNFNYYAPNSQILPFIQIGGGITTGYPVLLLGGGLRFSGDGFPSFAVSCGMASSWVKRLTSLKPGDVVTGTAEIEKDLKYEFNWPPKFYLGFQFQL